MAYRKHNGTTGTGNVFAPSNFLFCQFQQCLDKSLLILEAQQKSAHAIKRV